MNFSIIPEQASTFAPNVDLLFYSLAAFVSIFTVGVTAVLILLGIKFKAEPGRKSEHVENMKLELLWSAIPAVLALVIFAWGAILYFDYRNIPENTLDINVMGKQWMWKIQHSNGRREVNELHVPVGKAVKITMTSQDVLHDFYIPAFRVKQDAVPGRLAELWFNADREGIYFGQCSELCGKDHAYMPITVKVVSQEEFDAWVARVQTDGDYVAW